MTPSALQQPTAASVHMDTLRGVAALSVLMWHARALAFVDYAQIHQPDFLVRAAYVITGLGHQAVIVFFVLSGYLVGRGVIKNSSKGWQWRPYLLNRMTRLWVVLIPALLIATAIDRVGTHLLGGAYLYLGQGGQDVITWHVADMLHWQIWLGNLLFLQTILVHTFGSNAPLWSLANEFWYYMLFPMMLLVFSRRSKPVARVLYSLAVILILWQAGFSIAVAFPIWLMGAALVYAPRWIAYTRVQLNVAIGVAVLLMLAVANSERLLAIRPQFLDLVLGASCALVLWLMLQARFSVPRNLAQRSSHRLAAMSYSLYLFHVPLLVFLISMVNPHARWQPDLHHAMVGLLLLIAAWTCAFALYFCFERNTDAVRRWLTSIAMFRARESRPTRLQPDSLVASE